MLRKNPLETGQSYHIFNRSISGYRIFNEEKEFMRLQHSIRYYQWARIPYGFSHFVRSKGVESMGFERSLSRLSGGNKALVRIIAYCLMPTHIHLIIKQLMDNGISTFMGNILNSYSRYFNTKHRRHGPLWAGRFKEVLVRTDEQMLHLSRYVHLNPVTAGLVEKPELWTYSSYREYLGQSDPRQEDISQRDEVMGMLPKDYKKFVDDQKDYQRELKLIRDLLME